MSQSNAVESMLASQAGPVSAERMRETMEAYLESWRQNDPEARIRLFVDEPVVEDPVGTPAYRGSAAVRAFWAQAAWPGVAFDATLHAFVACGREALAHFTIRMSSSSRPAMNIEVRETVRFADDGRIAEIRAFWNQDCVRPDS